MQHLKVYNKQDVLSITKLRRFETKLGERIQVINGTTNVEKSLEQSPAKFVLVGVPEDIGAIANDSLGGSDTAWIPFLQSFLNVQSNDFLEGGDILLLGHFDFNEMASLIENNAGSNEEKIEAIPERRHREHDFARRIACVCPHRSPARACAQNRRGEPVCAGTGAHCV